MKKKIILKPLSGYDLKLSLCVDTYVYIIKCCVDVREWVSVETGHAMQSGDPKRRNL